MILPSGGADIRNDVLKRMSDHLDALAEEVFQIEHAIGEELGAQTGTQGQTITRLQRLDFLRQSLEDMAVLALLLTRQDFAETSSDRLRLDQSKAIVIGTAPRASTALHKESGELDLF